MFKRLALVGLAALLLMSQTGCTVMSFNAEGSDATSLEMSNVNGADGKQIVKKGAGHRGFFLLFALIPIHVPAVSDAIGPVEKAYDIEITTEEDIVDIGIAWAQSLIGLPRLLSSRSVVVKAEVE